MGTPTLEKLCIGLSSNKYMYNILNKNSGSLSIHEISKNKWNNVNTHTGKFLQGTTHSYYFKINFKIE
jgi:hypothetical protein